MRLTQLDLGGSFIGPLRSRVLFHPTSYSGIIDEKPNGCNPCDPFSGYYSTTTAGRLALQTPEAAWRAERTQFTALATSLGALDAQQEALKAQLQQVTQDLNAKIGQMKGLESRLRASLKGKYGTKNEKLEEFGIKPTRRAAPAQPPA